MKPIVALAFATFVFACIAAAQTTGLVRGVVKDADGKPVEGAKVTITTTDEVNRKFETKTGKNGDYLQIGLPTGTYTVRVDKDTLSRSQTIRVSNGAPSDANFVLAPTAAPEPSPAASATTVEFQQTFAEGIEAARAGKPDAAIEKFKHALELNPNCASCSSNLATIYYSEGVRSWTAGKIADAKTQFEAALKANPNHAESHFQLGMVLVNESHIPAAVDEFNTYLKLAPTGPNAEQAKAAVTALGNK
jgi:tetratricopeptide (TPR) repeat protein